jgi:hypothetical protein
MTAEILHPWEYYLQPSFNQLAATHCVSIPVGPSYGGTQFIFKSAPFALPTTSFPFEQ